MFLSETDLILFFKYQQELTQCIKNYVVRGSPGIFFSLILGPDKMTQGNIDKYKIWQKQFYIKQKRGAMLITAG
jgi:hypothetical protein